MKNKGYGFGVAGMMVLLFGWAGCTSGATFEEPNEVPDELQFVIDNDSDFTTADDDPLADVDAGQVIDVLADNIDGCWGAAATFVQDNGQPDITSFEAYRFDSQANTISWQIWQQLPVGTTDTVVALLVPEGTFEITGEDRIHVVFTTATVNNIQTGEVATGDFDDVPNAQNDSDVLVTTSDDGLKIANDIIQDGLNSQRENLVYRKFECPAGDDSADNTNDNGQ